MISSKDVFAISQLSVTLIMFLVCSEFPTIALSSDWYSTCSHSISCGPSSIVVAGFPFWGGLRTDSCGRPELQLYCVRETTNIDIAGVTYNVRSINQETKTIRIARADFADGICGLSKLGNNTVFDPHVFEYAPGSDEFTLLYDCSKPILDAKNINCTGGVYRYLVRSGTTPVKGSEYCSSKLTFGFSVKDYEELPGVSNPLASWFTSGFEVKYKIDYRTCRRCEGSGGVCGYDWYTNRKTCYCQNQTTWLSQSTCPSNNLKVSLPKTAAGSSNLKRIWVAIGISAALSGIIIVSAVLYCRKSSNSKPDERKVEEFIKNYGSSAPKQYSYANIKKMTNSFAEKIGRGGFGAVYKGQLPDGSPVAVKVLNETKGSGEDFINEVASIGQTSHVNVVTLLGFCYKGNKRALVYEYMPNGSLDKFIFGQPNPSESSSRLGWEALYNIAIGVARGLEYLHCGCKTRILHFDIKPQNILLDEDFCPKIADFGLAKLWLTKDSMVSMMGARGTIGYIAPEAFSGKVSYKSDVYSYGMLVLEMVGGRKNFDSGVSLTSEIYFPNWIYKDLERGEDVKILGVDATDEERKLLKKMILVSIWCIQTHPSDRPSMNNVIEMLEGSIESLQIPPKPYLFSPSRSPREVTRDYVFPTSLGISNSSVS